MIKMTDEGFVNLMEAIMEQAYKDAENDKDKALADEAKEYIDMMQKAFS